MDYKLNLRIRHAFWGGKRIFILPYWICNISLWNHYLMNKLTQELIKDLFTRGLVDGYEWRGHVKTIFVPHPNLRVDTQNPSGKKEGVRMS